MRIALLSKMTGELIEDMSKLLASEPTTGDSIVRLFELMNSTGHIKLLAWRAMEDGLDPDPKMQRMGSLHSIIDQITAELSDHDQGESEEYGVLRCFYRDWLGNLRRQLSESVLFDTYPTGSFSSLGRRAD